MGPSLQAFLKRIETEKPDTIVFLDKGSRVFATPFAHVLNEKENTSPDIRFFNDTLAKKLFIENPGLSKEDFQKEMISLFPDIGRFLEKKVFFFDEIHAQGLGAAIIQKMSKGDNWKYFCLSFSPSDMTNRGYEEKVDDEIIKQVNTMKESGQFISYGHIRSNVFSREAARLYVSEPQSSTERSKKLETADTQYSVNPDNPSMKIPNAFWSTDEKEQKLFSESQDELQKERIDTVRKIKDLIYETLKEKK
jgi:hypothetical protein